MLYSRCCHYAVSALFCSGSLASLLVAQVLMPHVTQAGISSLSPTHVTQQHCLPVHPTDRWPVHQQTAERPPQAHTTTTKTSTTARAQQSSNRFPGCTAQAATVNNSSQGDRALNATSGQVRSNAQASCTHNPAPTAAATAWVVVRNETPAAPQAAAGWESALCLQTSCPPQSLRPWLQS